MKGTQIFNGMSDASGAAALDEGNFIVANDEDNDLRIYNFDNPGAQQIVKLSEVFEDAIFDGEDLEIDIEGAAQLGDKIFWIGSHSASKKGKFRPARHRLFAVNVAHQTGGEFSVSPAGQIYTTLIADLEKDARFVDFRLNEAKTIKPKDIGGLSIEGLTATPDGALFIAFRNPLGGGQVVDGFLVGGRALMVKLLNPLEVIEGREAKFDAPIELDLGGFGIRNIEYYEAENKYLIVGGPYHENEDTPAHPRETNRLYLWSGDPNNAPEMLENVNLEGFNIEAAFFFPHAENSIILLSDDGKSGSTNSFRAVSVELKRQGENNEPSEAASQPSITFGSKANPAVVSQRTRTILSEILNHAGVNSCLITSTSRTPAEQARVMFNNLETLGVKSQKDLYGAAGDMVIDVYSAAKSANKTASQIKAAMEAKIKAIGPEKVSHHCADPATLNVIDVAPSSISNKHAFENAVNFARNSGKVSRFITPGSGDPAYHIEIPQH